MVERFAGEVLSFQRQFFYVLIYFLWSVSASAQVDPALLSIETLKRYKRVPEFSFIIKEANKLGVKVYLFGGTASAFAHYVRWDLEREAGDDKYQKERFDYDFTNIYRGNQDLDIVVDGTSEQADTLKRILQDAYPHFIGSREAWEVRLLKESRGDKRALLGDDDFKNQHSDTNSTGMLALNPSQKGIVYNDLLKWGKRKSNFLEDVALAKIKFLFSEHHKTTQRYRDGLNPPALAAIRFLAKVAQYEVKYSEEDMKRVTEIIQASEFEAFSEYGKNKAGEFALKTLLNAPNSEYAWNLLEMTGVRKKLIEIDAANINKVDSLSWWLNKEPLRSSQIGQGQGRTAQEIFGSPEIIVSHETNNFQAYDNITRSARGEANAFISRAVIEGEAAAFGDGFYVRLGKSGARGTGLTIRFRLHPQAKEGTDFTRYDNYIVIKNKKALILIQENLNLNLSDFLQLLISGDLGKEDKGLLEKFKRKFKRLISNRDQEFVEAVQLVKSLFVEQYGFELFQSFGEELSFENLMSSVPFHDYTILHLMSIFGKKKSFDAPDIKWLQNMIANLNRFNDKMEAYYVSNLLSFFPQNLLKTHPVIIEQLIDLNNTNINNSLLNTVFIKPGWEKYPDLIERMVRGVHLYRAQSLIDLLSKSAWSTQPDLLEKYINSEGAWLHDVVEKILSKEAWSKHPYLLDLILTKKTSGLTKDVIQHVLSKPYWYHQAHIVEKFVDQNKNLSSLVQFVFSEKYWSHRSDLIEKLVKSEKVDASLITHVLTKYTYPESKKWFSEIKERGKSDIAIIKYMISKKDTPENYKMLVEYIERHELKLDKVIVNHIFSQYHWFKHQDLLVKLIERNYVDDLIVKNVLARKDFSEFPHLVEMILSKKDDLIEERKKGVARYLFTKKEGHKYIKIVERLIRENFDMNLNFLKEPGWAAYPYLIETLIDQESDGVLNILKSKTWLEHPYLVEKIIQKKSSLRDKVSNILIERHWYKTYPHLVESFIEKGIDDKKMIMFVLSNRGWRISPSWVDQLLAKNNYGIDSELLNKVLGSKFAADYPRWIIQLVQREHDSIALEEMLRKPHWKKHPLLSAFVGQENVTFKNLSSALKQKDFGEFLKTRASVNSALICSEFL